MSKFKVKKDKKEVVEPSFAMGKSNFFDKNYLARIFIEKNHLRISSWFFSINLIIVPLGVNAQALPMPIVAAENGPIVILNDRGQAQVEIMSPNSPGGLSHNRYEYFDVPSIGVVLNNETAKANIILNEVISKNDSYLDGYIKVNGQTAEVILANPNGITCDGCGFINAIRGVLTTGKPNIDSYGNLTDFRVNGGEVTIESDGLISYRAAEIDLGKVDLIASKVRVAGTIRGKKIEKDSVVEPLGGENIVMDSIGIIAGDHQVKVEQDKVKKQIVSFSASPICDAPIFPISSRIDVSLLGGMYAKRIYMQADNIGIGVKNSEEMMVFTESLVIDASGHLTLNGPIKIMGDFDIKNAIAVTSHDNLEVSGKFSIENVSSFYHGLKSASGLSYTVSQFPKITAKDINIQVNQFNNNAKIWSHQTLKLTATDALHNIGGQLQANVLEIQTKKLFHQTPIFVAKRDKTYEDKVGNIGLISGHENVKINVRDQLTIKGATIDSLFGSVDIDVQEGNIEVIPLILEERTLKELERKARFFFITLESYHQLEDIITQQTIIPRIHAHKGLNLISKEQILLKGASLSADQIYIESQNKNIDIRSNYLTGAYHKKTRDTRFDIPSVVSRTETAYTLSSTPVDTKILFKNQFSLLAENGNIYLGNVYFQPYIKINDTDQKNFLNFKAQAITTINQPHITIDNIKVVDTKTQLTAEWHSSIAKTINDANNEPFVSGDRAIHKEADYRLRAQRLANLSQILFGDTLGGSFGWQITGIEKNTYIKNTHINNSRFYADNIDIESTKENIKLEGVDIYSEEKIQITSAKNLLLGAGEEAKSEKTNMKQLTSGMNFGISGNLPTASAGTGVTVHAEHQDQENTTQKKGYRPFSVVANQLVLRSRADTILRGGQLRGKEWVNLHVQGGLDIRSLQELHTSHSTKSILGGSLGLNLNLRTMVGVNGDVHIGGGSTEDNSAKVLQQTGIVAGMLHGRVDKNLVLLGSHIIATQPITSNLVIKGKTYAEHIQDTQNKEGSFEQFGIGVTQAALAGINLDFQFDEKIKYKAINRATISGINIDHQGIEGELNPDAEKLLAVQIENQLGNITLNFVLAAPVAFKTTLRKGKNKQNQPSDRRPIDTTEHIAATVLTQKMDSLNQDISALIRKQDSISSSSHIKDAHLNDFRQAQKKYHELHIKLPDELNQSDPTFEQRLSQLEIKYDHLFTKLKLSSDETTNQRLMTHHEFREQFSNIGTTDRQQWIHPITQQELTVVWLAQENRPVALRLFKANDRYREVDPATGQFLNRPPIYKLDDGRFAYTRIQGGMLTDDGPQGAHAATTSRTQFSLNQEVPLYKDLKNHEIEGMPGWWHGENKQAGYSYYKGTSDVFVHFEKIGARSQTDSRFGDKLHISVHNSEVERAFNALAPLLLSKDAPLKEWKMTDMNDPRAATGEKVDRILDGMQFTLYFRPNDRTQGYTADQLGKIRDFCAAIEHTLKQKGIMPGEIPNSDIMSRDWDYVSHRNDAYVRIGNKINERQRRTLQEGQFFKSITPNHEIKPDSDTLRTESLKERALELLPLIFSE